MIQLNEAEILDIAYNYDTNDIEAIDEQLETDCLALNDEKIYTPCDRVKRTLIRALTLSGRDWLDIYRLRDHKGALSVTWGSDLSFIVGNDYITRAWKEEREHHLLHYVDDELVATTC